MLTFRGLTAVVLVGTDSFGCEMEWRLISVEFSISELREQRLLYLYQSSAYGVFGCTRSVFVHRGCAFILRVSKTLQDTNGLLFQIWIVLFWRRNHRSSLVRFVCFTICTNNGHSYRVMATTPKDQQMFRHVFPTKVLLSLFHITYVNSVY